MLNIILIVSLNVAILIMVSYLWSLNESFNCPKNGMIKCDRIHNKKMRENVCELLKQNCELKNVNKLDSQFIEES